MLAVQLATAPRVVLLDEPTRGLDHEAKERLTVLLRELAAEGRLVVVATHDVEFVARTADRVVVLAEGDVVADGPTADVVVASPAFAPQVAKVLHPDRWLTVDEVAAALQRHGGLVIASRDRSVLRVAPRTAVALLVASVAGLAMFAWPLVIDPPADFSHTRDAPYIFALILPALVAIVLTELTGRGMDTKALAMLGVLSAIGAILRPLGAGTGGIELVFFLLVLGGRVYGPAFGFVLGSTTLFASALLTGGMGPWLPFQMLASSWVGLLAGLLPPARGRAEIALLAVYAGLSAYLYGFLVNLWGWPFALGTDTALSYVPGAAVLDNLHRFLLYTLATSTWGWDTGRAITNVAAVLLVGPAVLATLRRATRKAAFDAAVTFDVTPARDV